jgi:hypothetical protein
MNCLEEGISFTRKHKGLQDCFEDGVEEEENLDDIDPEYENMLQNNFQDEVVSNIFSDIAKYVDSQALSFCEYIIKDDIEQIINSFDMD